MSLEEQWNYFGAMSADKLSFASQELPYYFKDIILNRYYLKVYLKKLR